MRYAESVLLGYELGTAKEVTIPLRHIVVLGQTGQAGKTVCLEAIVSRSKQTGIAFRTKRGELGFETAHEVPLYFTEKGLTDWKSLEGLIESTLMEKVKYEPGMRGQIIGVCAGATSITDIYNNVKTKLENERRGFVKDVLTKLLAYLDIVIPQIKTLAYTDTLQLKEGGMNVMNLVGLTDEVQNLIVQAVMKEVYAKHSNTLLILPECWRFIPQDRGSPVKPIAERLIREGDAVGIHLLLDSQDLRSVDKKYLRSVDSWLFGRQRDSHEIDALLETIPLPRGQKPKPDEIMRLPVGHFIAAVHDDVKRVYILPEWLPAEVGKRVALGEVASDSEEVMKYEPARKAHEEAVPRRPQEEVAEEEDWSDIHREVQRLAEKVDKLTA